jgi:hypothetical protein
MAAIGRGVFVASKRKADKAEGDQRDFGAAKLDIQVPEASVLTSQARPAVHCPEMASARKDRTLYELSRCPLGPSNTLGGIGVGRSPPRPSDCLIALTFRIRRAILMPKRLYSIGTCLQFQIDVRIVDFVAWRSVSHD